MPTSDIDQIPDVVKAVMAYEPDSILDVGLGCGKYALLLREYIDGQTASPVETLVPGSRHLRIDGVEAYAPYITPIHTLLYDNIVCGSIVDVCLRAAECDVVMMIDVIEHIPKDSAIETLRVLSQKARKGIVIATPVAHIRQTALHGNAYEEHVSVWQPSDFGAWPNVQSLVVGTQRLICISTGEPRNMWLYKQIVKRSLFWPARKLWWQWHRARRSV
jgi:hypothetical protein